MHRLVVSKDRLAYGARKGKEGLMLRTTRQTRDFQEIGTEDKYKTREQ
jgi:hypothetical protein